MAPSYFRAPKKFVSGWGFYKRIIAYTPQQVVLTSNRSPLMNYARPETANSWLVIVFIFGLCDFFYTFSAK